MLLFAHFINLVYNTSGNQVPEYDLFNNELRISFPLDQAFIWSFSLFVIFVTFFMDQQEHKKLPLYISH